MPAPSSLARLQQVITVWVAACALGWAWAWWDRAAAVAILGALVIAFTHAWVMGAEFLILREVRREDPAPRASGRQLLLAWGAEACLGLLVFAWRQPFRWRAIPDRLQGPRVAGRHGVVFVHGFVCNRGFWTPWRRRLESEGRAHVSVNLEPVFAAIDVHVPTLDAAVQAVRQATGLPPLLVCHSMGGLVARAWLREQRDDGAAAHVVTIGSPHAGTWLARFSHLPNGLQMRQCSAWLRALAEASPAGRAARFTCWWSNCDNIVMPPSTATLADADNRFVPGAAHVQLAFRREVMAGTLALLADLDAKAAAPEVRAAARRSA